MRISLPDNFNILHSYSNPHPNPHRNPYPHSHSHPLSPAPPSGVSAPAIGGTPAKRPISTPLPPAPPAVKTTQPATYATHPPVPPAGGAPSGSSDADYDHYNSKLTILDFDLLKVRTHYCFICHRNISMDIDFFTAYVMCCFVILMYHILIIFSIILHIE